MENLNHVRNQNSLNLHPPTSLLETHIEKCTACRHISRDDQNLAVDSGVIFHADIDAPSLEKVR
jgi:hypothetical protein